LRLLLLHVLDMMQQLLLRLLLRLLVKGEAVTALGAVQEGPEGQEKAMMKAMIVMVHWEEEPASSHLAFADVTLLQ
jgi:hypothetical protein